MSDGQSQTTVIKRSTAEWKEICALYRDKPDALQMQYFREVNVNRSSPPSIINILTEATVFDAYLQNRLVGVYTLFSTIVMYGSE